MYQNVIHWHGSKQGSYGPHLQQSTSLRPPKRISESHLVFQLVDPLPPVALGLRQLLLFLGSDLERRHAGLALNVLDDRTRMRLRRLCWGRWWHHWWRWRDWSLCYKKRIKTIGNSIFFFGSPTGSVTAGWMWFQKDVQWHLAPRAIPIRVKSNSRAQ